MRPDVVNTRGRLTYSVVAVTRDGSGATFYYGRVAPRVVKMLSARVGILG